MSALAATSLAIRALLGLWIASQMTFGGAPRSTLIASKSESRVMIVKPPDYAASQTPRSGVPSPSFNLTWDEPSNA